MGYELWALLMRYIYVFLGVLILWRAYRWLRRDARAYKKEMRSLPDAGLIGEVVDLSTGKSQPLPREGMMGAARSCDIRVKGTGVKRKHALFALEEGKGLQIIPHLGGKVIMEGIEVRGSAHALHGTIVQLGEKQLRVRLFAGLKVPHPSQFPMEAPYQEEGREAWDSFEQDMTPPPFQSPFQAPFVPQEEGEMPVYGNVSRQAEVNMPFIPPMPQEAEEEGEDEALPYQSPLPQRRRRSRR